MYYSKSTYAIDGAPQVVNGLYSVGDISEHLKETKQGFLICCDVPITRAGDDLLYAAQEINDPAITPKNGVVTVSRDIQDMLTPETIASFEMMPITIGHPKEFVNPDNVKDLIVGNVRNVRQGKAANDDKLIADLVIFDPVAIEAIKSGELREVSCGYDVRYIPDGVGRARQEEIIGNHLALVQAGRCGSECAVIDNAPNHNRGKKSMINKLFRKKVAKAIDEALMEIEAPAEDEMTDKEKLDDLVGRISKLEGNRKPFKGEDDMTEKSELDDLIGRVAKLEGNKEAFKNETPAQKKYLKEEDEETDLATRIGEIHEMVKHHSQLLAKLMGMEAAEGENLEEQREAEEDAASCGTAMDQQTISRAEILAPGIYIDPKMTKAELCANALQVAYQSTDTREIIESIIAGRDLKTVDVEMVFNAAAVARGAAQAARLNASKAYDGVMLPHNTTGSLGLANTTPAMLNAYAKQYYQSK